MAQPTWYQILGIAPSADQATIKRAYRQKIRAVHPDQFAGERARLEAAGLVVPLRELDEKIRKAQLEAQQINQAYTVLSDPTQRAAYDRERAAARMAAQEQQIQREREQHPEYGRRTVKSRHHAPEAAPTPGEEARPWLILVSFLVIVIIALTQVNRFLWSIDDGRGRGLYIPQAPTSENLITSNELQATQSVLSATRIQRTANAALPTDTPRPVTNNARAAQLLYEAGQYENAIRLYDQAIDTARDEAQLYFERGLAYVALAQQTGEERPFNRAIADFTGALALDETLAMAHRERGLLYFERWQREGTLADARIAYEDLLTYQDQLDTTVPAEIQTYLDELTTVVSG